MNHSSRKRGETRSEEELQKEKEYSGKITQAWDTFIKVRKGWKESEKTIDELLDYSVKLMGLISEASSVYNFRQDLLNEKFTILLKGFKELAKRKAELEHKAKEQGHSHDAHSHAGDHHKHPKKEGAHADKEGSQNKGEEAKKSIPHEEITGNKELVQNSKESQPTIKNTENQPSADKKESEGAPAENKEPEKTPEEKLKEDKAKLMSELENIIKFEMEMLVGLAMKDPKCYQIWHHRKWMFAKIWEIESALGIQGVVSKKCVAMDLKICDKFLAKDERNFHAWNYRCFLINYQLERFPGEAVQILTNELKFLQTKLEANFSNYSALHFKTKYLLLLEKYKHPGRYPEEIGDDGIPLTLDIIRKELEFVKEGLFIAPFEQSLWIYLGWLLDRKRVWVVSGAKVETSTPSNTTGGEEGASEPAESKTAGKRVKIEIKTGGFHKASIFKGSLIVVEKGGQERDLEYQACEDGIFVTLPDGVYEFTIRAAVFDEEGSTSAFLFTATDFKINQNNEVEFNAFEPERLKKSIEEILSLWDDTINTVREISDSEPKNREACLNYFDLVTKNHDHKTLLAKVYGPLSSKSSLDIKDLSTRLDTVMEGVKENVPLVTLAREQLKNY